MRSYIVGRASRGESERKALGAEYGRSVTVFGIPGTFSGSVKLIVLLYYILGAPEADLSLNTRTFNLKSDVLNQFLVNTEQLKASFFLVLIVIQKTV